MADGEGNSLKEFTMTWIVKNFSFSWHKCGKAIVSPRFRARIFQSTEWFLKVYPRGISGNGALFCCLERNPNGPKELKFDVAISLLCPDGSVLEGRSSTNETFRRDNGKDYGFFVKQELVFAERRAELLPDETLTVRCRLWTRDQEKEQSEQLFAQTRLETVRELIYGSADRFSSIETNGFRCVDLTSTSLEINPSRINLLLMARPNCDCNVMLQIIFPDERPLKFSTCKINLVDCEGNKLECGRSEINFEKSYNWTIPLYPTKWKLMANSSLYLPNDTLSLECELVICTGNLSEKIKDTFAKLSSDENLIDDVNRYIEPPPSSALGDLYDLYRNQVLCDVSLKTNTDTFPAHSVVLSARSTVFRAMFSRDMKEKMNGCVDITDIDSETVRRLLLYVYTDQVEQLRWDTAVQLYAAAEKYAITSLKNLCSAFLKKSISLPGACELLALADMYQDVDLEKFVHTYIMQNDEKIFGLSEWKDMEQKNPQLIIQTLRRMYRNVNTF